MHRQFSLFDWFPYIKAHIGVNCLELTGRCICLACNRPPWHSIISRVNSCLYPPVFLSDSSSCRMLSRCLWGNGLSLWQTQICMMVAEVTELCFGSRERIPRQLFTPWDHQTHLGPMLFPKDILSLNLSLFLSYRYQKTDDNFIKIDFPLVDPTFFGPGKLKFCKIEHI